MIIVKQGLLQVYSGQSIFNIANIIGKEEIQGDLAKMLNRYNMQYDGDMKRVICACGEYHKLVFCYVK